jgi:uncharacterized repeat protein (TIGR02543 family)
VGNIIIKNMQFTNDTADSRPVIRITGTESGQTFINCLWADAPAIAVDIQNDGTSYFINCAAYNSGAEAFTVPATGTGTTVYMYNCVVLNAATYGFVVEGWRTMHCKNCYADGDTAGFTGLPNSTFSATTCASSDGSESTTTVAMATGSGAYFTNVTAGSEDATIGASSSLADAGTDLSADGTYPFDYDWEGDTRSDWSIGPDEIVAAIPTYTVTYNANSGTGTLTDGSSPYEESDTVTVLDPTDGTIARTGYRFIEWNTAANGSGTAYNPDDTFSMGTENVTLYAQWAQEFSVTYDGNGEDSGSVPTDANDYIDNETVTVAGSGTLVKDGYAITEWNTAANGSGTGYSLGSTFSMPNSNVTLYAQWSEVGSADEDGFGAVASVIINQLVQTSSKKR